MQTNLRDLCHLLEVYVTGRLIEANDSKTINTKDRDSSSNPCKTAWQVAEKIETLKEKHGHKPSRSCHPAPAVYNHCQPNFIFREDFCSHLEISTKMTSYHGKQADPGLYFHCLRTALASYGGHNFRSRHLKPRKCGAVVDCSDQGTNTPLILRCLSSPFLAFFILSPS